MIGLVLLAASSLPLPQSELSDVPVSKAHMPRFVFMCRSEDDRVGAIVDVQNDSKANYLSIRRTGQPNSHVRAPIARAAHRESTDSYTMQLATGELPEGVRVTLQVQAANGGPLAGWFDWAGAERLSGSCRSVPAPPAKAERG